MQGKKKSLAKKLSITILIVLVVLMAATYIGASFLFADRYYYNTVINGTDVSYKTPVEAEEVMYERLYGYSLKIQGREGMRDMILPAEIEMKYLFNDSLLEVKKQQKPGLWIIGFFKESVYELPGLIEYNEAALDQKIDGLTFFKKENIRAPSDAYLTYSEEEHKYVIIESKPGTEIIREKTKTEIADALDMLEADINLEESDCYKHAELAEDGAELQDALAQANKYVSTKIDYDWNGNEVLVDGDRVQDWVTVKKEQVKLDEDKIREFVSEQAETYDTYGKNQIFHATDGREIDTKGIPYGWKTDTEKETEALIKSVKNGETMEKQPAHSYTAAEEGQEDIGESYVEIDLGNQHLYLYVDGEMVLESDLVSGNASRGWSTPAGAFGLTYKTRDAVLRGDNYETPVSYWMPFNGNIGMHDATWRGSFGGDIYKTNGSHGCINLPYEKAKIIYEYMYTGFPVVCYY